MQRRSFAILLIAFFFQTATYGNARLQSLFNFRPSLQFFNHANRVVTTQSDSGILYYSDRGLSVKVAGNLCGAIALSYALGALTLFQLGFPQALDTEYIAGALGSALMSWAAVRYFPYWFPELHFRGQSFEATPLTFENPRMARRLFKILYGKVRRFPHNPVGVILHVEGFDEFDEGRSLRVTGFDIAKDIAGKEWESFGLTQTD